MLLTICIIVMCLTVLAISLYATHLCYRAHVDNQEVIEHEIAMLREATRRMREAEQHYLEMVSRISTNP